MPYTFDATLPAAQRYASLKFRRVAPKFNMGLLSYAEAQELVAFILTIGHVPARHIFHWKPQVMPEVQRLVKHMEKDPAVQAAVEANRAAYTRADGLAVLRAMQEGGWKAANVPEVVRLAFLDMRDSGMTRQQVADAAGVTLDQVRVICHGVRTGRAAVPLSSAGIFAN